MAPTGNEVLVCEDCGAECNARDRLEFNGTEPCEENDSHNWSAGNPLARLKARVKSTPGLEVNDWSSSGDWQWIEVNVAPADAVTGSEMLSNMVQQEGFKFLGLGDESTEFDQLRFNRKKEEDQ